MMRFAVVLLTAGLLASPSAAHACKGFTENVDFALGDSRIGPTQDAGIERFAKGVIEIPTSIVLLHAYAKDLEEERSDLAQARADVVVERLETLGVPKSSMRITISSFSRAMPSVSLQRFPPPYCPMLDPEASVPEPK